MKDKDILFTIITPIYNGETYLNQMIESVIKQDYKNYELLLINDGSTDNSLKICEEYKKRDKRITVINKSNSGVSDTRNLGIKKAKGKYICFLDSDDYIESDYLSKFNKMINGNINNLYCCGINKVSDDIREAKQDIFEPIFLKEKHNIVFSKYGGYIWNKVFIKELLVKNNIYFKKDIYMCEDTVFTIEYLNYIDEIVLNSEKLYNYRILNASASKKMDNKKWFSIFKALECLINQKVEDKDYNSNCIFFKYYYGAYGLYRLKFIDDDTFKNKWERKIKDYYKNYSKEKQFLSLFQKIKIFVYKNFGLIAFKIKR